MQFLTSISPKRIERQQYCMSTWLQYGEIIAVQTAGDIPSLQPQFPDVQFVATEKTAAKIFGYPGRVNISAMVDQGPGLLINSDIKIDTNQKQFDSDWPSNTTTQLPRVERKLKRLCWNKREVGKKVARRTKLPVFSR